MAKSAVFEAMIGSNLYGLSIIMCFLAHLSFYPQVSFVIRCPSVVGGPPKDHLDKAWLKLAKWFLTRRFLNDFLLIYLHNQSISAKVQSS
jgi:hypothetical protein